MCYSGKQVVVNSAIVLLRCSLLVKKYPYLSKVSDSEQHDNNKKAQYFSCSRNIFF
jgi:hypothetical protein